MKKISIMILLLVAVLASCKKTPEVNLKYVDVERDLITVGTTTATIQCDYEYIATLKKAYLYYGEGEDATDMISAEMRVVQNTLYVDLSGLKENTTISYYYEFVNGFNSMRSATKTFKTEASPNSVTLPTVVTAEVAEITANSAKGGGEVTNDGGAEVTERGICWGTNANPDLNDNHVSTGVGTGVFTAMMSGLGANTTYHFRAYATNEVGTAYGLDREFVTLSGGGGSGDAPIGAINGLFTINENGDKVYFSQGNLQYQASTNTWRFAENQWDYVGDATNGSVYENGVKCNNELISSTYKGWIDLFGWGTSGFGHGANCYQPWSTNTDCSDYFAYGNLSNGLFSQNGQADWGYNAISNGGNAINLWRTLTFEEFNYVFEFRQTSSNYRYVKATVNGIHGYLVFPDNWDPAVYEFNNVNDWIVIFDVNSITESAFEMLESRGVVFMPASGYRHITIVEWVHWDCYYWASNIINIGYAHSFNSNTDPDGHGFSWPFPDNPGSERYKGLSVRLVQNAN